MEEVHLMIWLVICACISFMMQAGFTLLETGSVRAKNSVNVAMKNLADFIVVSVLFILVGYHITRGESLFNFAEWEITTANAPYILFNTMFVATAATIVSGCVAERMSFRGYLLISIIMVLIIYPLVAFWIWNPHAWLNRLGFHDFAGAGVVHLAGGSVGLIGTLMIGPREGRFSKNSVWELSSNNHTLATVGVFFMLFAWMGFNGGSLYELSDRVPLIILKTILAGSVAGCVALLLVFRRKHLEIFYILNSILGGLVAITACADIATVYDAAVLGLLAAVTVYWGEKLLLAARIDDPINAVSIHMMCGLVGLLYTGLLIEQTGSIHPFLIQAMGALAVLTWCTFTAWGTFQLLRYLKLDRVTSEDEAIGLNISEHGVKMTWLETVKTIEQISNSGDYTLRVPVEHGTEAGDVALSFNQLMDKLEANITVLHQISRGQLQDIDLPEASDDDILAKSIHTMLASLRGLLNNVEHQLSQKEGELAENEQSLQDLLERFKETQNQILRAEKMAALTGLIVGVSHELNTPLGNSFTSLSMLKERIATLSEAFEDRSIKTQDLENFLTFSHECMELVLNNILRSIGLMEKMKTLDQQLLIESTRDINLKSFIGELLGTMNSRLEQAGVSVSVDCPDDICLSLAPTALQNVIEELLENSLVHGFSEEQTSKEISVVAQEKPDRLELIIHDNGQGVNSQTLKKMFQPFFTTRRSKGGTGLGLHMVYNVCTHKFGGNIRVEDDGGCRFTITIPT